MVPFIVFLMSSFGTGQPLTPATEMGVAGCAHRASVLAASAPTNAAGCCDACPCKGSGNCDCANCPCQGAGRRANARGERTCCASAKSNANASDCGGGCCPGCCGGGCCGAGAKRAGNNG